MSSVDVDAQAVIRRLTARIGDLSYEVAVAQAVNETLSQQLEEHKALQGPGGD